MVFDNTLYIKIVALDEIYKFLIVALNREPHFGNTIQSGGGPALSQGYSNEYWLFLSNKLYLYNLNIFKL
jgi:hypothetical protein